MSIGRDANGADVVVIGAGVIGCSIAFHLVRAGARVTVFDKGAEGAGMSPRSGALLRMHYTFEPEAALAWQSLRYFRNWNEIVGGECGFVRTGFALVVDAENLERLRANVAMLQGIGVDTQILDPAQLAELESEARLDDIAAAAYESQSGYADPVATTNSLAAAARRLGADFELNVPVHAIGVHGGRVSGIILGDGRAFEAKSVCVAAGPWTDMLLASVDLQIGIRAERAQIAFFHRPPRFRHCAYIDTAIGSYFRPHASDLTLVGIGELRHHATIDPDRFKTDNDREFVADARRRLAKRMPGMADATYVRGHAGIYDVTADARPALGPVAALPGLFVAAGFSGTGFKISPAVGAAMAETILTGKVTTSLAPFAFERFAQGRLIRAAHEYVLRRGFGHTV